MKYYDPCSKSPVVKVRWKIAGQLNRLPWTCWASIVSWSLGSRRLVDRFGDDGIRRTAACFQPGDERCYCGKFPNPARLEQVRQNVAIREIDEQMSEQGEASGE